jgi:hypothetical protein
MNLNSNSNSHPYLVQSFQNWRRWFAAILGFVTAVLLFCWWEARDPDLSLDFSREAHSKLDPSLLARKMENVSEWKTWFHSTRSVQVVDSQNHPLAPTEQVAREGALLEIQIDPGKGARKRFQLAARINRYIPGQLLEIQVLDDSKGKLPRLFKNVTWRIELLPQAEQEKGVLIRGTEEAHTTHWRSRLFGRIAPKILLNQIFYPNLLILANPDAHQKPEGSFI